MGKQIIVTELSEIEPLRSRVSAAAERTALALAEFPIGGLNGIEILRRMKFSEMAWHPIAGAPKDTYRAFAIGHRNLAADHAS